MPTGNKHVRLFNKRILPLVQFKDQFLDYLRNYIEAVQSANYNNDCTIGLSLVPVVIDANLTLDVAATGGPYKGTTGTGRIVTFTNGVTEFQNITLPGVAAAVFHIGLEQNLLDTGVEMNPRSGEVEYSEYQEVIGRLGTPSSVVDNGDGTITFNLNGLLGTDNYAGGAAPRTVRVWLKAKQDGGAVGPQSADPAVAFETRTLTFAGGNNRITTAGRLGQNPAAVSTTAADYRVCVLGPTVRKSTDEDLRTTSGCWYLAAATINGGGTAIASISTADQRLSSATLSDLAPVLRLDAHSALKIRVIADASDVNEPQLEVQDSGAVTRFKVDEDGNVTITASEGIALDATGGPNSAGGKFTGGTGNSNGVEVAAVGTGKAIKVTAGDAELPAANKYTFAAVRSRSQHIPATDFQKQPSWSDGNHSDQSYVGHRREAMQDSIFVGAAKPGTQARGRWTCPVRLPHGAVIKDITVLYTQDGGGAGADGNTGINGKIELFKKTFSAGTITSTRLNATAGAFGGTAIGGPGNTESTLDITDETVDNVNAWYELSLELNSAWQRSAAVGTFASVSESALCVMPDGKILVTGGVTGGASVATVKIFDPWTGEFTTKTSMNHARAGHKMYLFRDGKIVAFGGHTGDGTTRMQTVESYDPATDAWTDYTGSFTNALGFSWAPSPRGDVLWALAGTTAGQERVLSLISGSSNSVTAQASAAADRVGAALIFMTDNDKEWLVAFGGGADLTTRTDTAAMYNTVTNAWTTATGTMAATRNSAQVAPWDVLGQVLIWGGAATASSELAYISPGTTTIGFTTMAAPLQNHSDGRGFVGRNGEILSISASGSLNPMIYKASADTNISIGQWVVLSGNAIHETARSSANRTGSATILPDGTLAYISGGTMYMNDLRGCGNQLYWRRPNIRFHGVRINYDYTEVNPET